MSKRYKILIVLFSSLSLLSFTGRSVPHTQIKVIDSSTKMPVTGAIVTYNDNAFYTDENGLLKIEDTVERVSVRACGYLRTDSAVIKPLIGSPAPIELVPFKPKGLYLSFYGIGSTVLRGAAL